MTREEFNSLCQNCCSRKSISECLFADAEEGFIDTSAESDGSRGIAFSKRKMMVNFDGTIKIVAYKKIRSIHIIGSLEGAFADELEISGEHSRLRITDFSLNKHILKQIIEGLREGLTEPITENNDTKEPPAAEEKSLVSEEKNEVVEKADFDDKSDNIPENAQNIPENDGILHEYEDKIEWLSSAPDITHDEKIEWLSSMAAEKSEPVIPETDFTDESEMREQIGQMSREETLGFLSKTLGEINGGAPVYEESAADDKPFFPTTQTAVIPENALPPKPIIEKIAAQNPPAERSPASAAARDNGELSKEPIWGDIYIKASKSLRELCENGRLSMDIIEKELRERLLDSAKSFADIVKDEQKIPKTLVPKIAELKNAADHFDEYFSHGEDVGVRVMFFMLFQMLCYSDRIAENPETKERLNDFFRRFGTAGITLSMLDARG